MRAMKVSDLIAALQAFPPDMLVMVDGYEDDLDHAAVVRETYAMIDKNTDNKYSGRHVEVGGVGDVPGSVPCIVVTTSPTLSETDMRITRVVVKNDGQVVYDQRVSS